MSPRKMTVYSFMNDTRPEVIKHQDLSGDHLHGLVTAGCPRPKDSSVEVTPLWSLLEYV